MVASKQALDQPAAVQHSNAELPCHMESVSAVHASRGVSLVRVAPAARRRVNQKALDQFAAMQDERAELSGRHEENAVGESKIRELMANLDQRKDEAIQKTFKVGLWL